MRTLSLCTFAAGAILSQLLSGHALAEPVVQSPPEIKAVFEQELFELAHTVFLANGNLKEALGVVERAVKARPADLVWRKKAAQTAEWAGRPDLALDHWFYLAEHGSREARQAALRLSRSLHEFPIRKQLLAEMVVGGLTDPELQKEYLAVTEELGLPQEAYDLLASGKMRSGNRAWELTEQARLAEMLGRPVDAVSAWQKRAFLIPLTADESLKLASLWYGQGDVEQAWLVLKQAGARAPATATAFWRTYTDLAWARQKTVEAMSATERLIHNGTAIAADYQRMQEIYSVSNPGQAYRIATAGWKRFQLPIFWYTMVDTGLRIGRTQELAHFLRGLGPDGRKKLAYDARSWMSMAQVYRQAGDQTASVTAARTAVRLAPSDAGLLSSYLWLLLDLKRTSELRPLVRDWETRITAIPELQEPLAAAMLLLGDAPRALRYYRAMALHRQDDPAWQVSFADVLEQAGHSDAAWKVRHNAQLQVRNRLKAGKLTKEALRTVLLTQAQLLVYLAPGDGLTAHMQSIATGKRDDLGKELIMGWAMATAQTDLARLWYWRNYARATKRPEWAQLGLALEENDRPTLAGLLDTKLDQLPYRDAVEAAQRAGFIPLAQEHAWQRFQLNREDYLLDSQVRQLFGARHGFVQSGLKLQDQSGVGWAESSLTVSQPLNNRYSLLAEMTEREFSLLKSNVLGWLPQHDLGGRLVLTRRHEGGHLAMSLGMRDGGLASYATAGLEGMWQPWHDLQLNTKLEFNYRADETAALSVGGTRDRLVVTTLGTLTARDTVSLELAAIRYHDQGRKYLGQGQSLGGELRHQFTQTWPDYGVRFFGGYNSYRGDGVVSDKTAALVPHDANPGASFFVPESFGHLGAGLFLGQNWKSNYTRDWKPFAETDIEWNSNSGHGFSYSLGMVGPLLGLDQLMFEITQGSGQFGTSDLTTTIGFGYRFFY